MWTSRKLFLALLCSLTSTIALTPVAFAVDQPLQLDQVTDPELLAPGAPADSDAPGDEARPDPGIADPGLDSGDLQDPDTADPGFSPGITDEAKPALPPATPNDKLPEAAVTPEAKPKSAKPTDFEPLKPVDQVAERAKLLGGLYDRLAAAKSKDEATALETAIEHVWAEPQSATAGLLIVRAGQLSQSGDNATAYKLLDSAIRFAPNDSVALTRRAYMRLADQDFGKALADLRQALALDPRNYRAIGALAQILKEFDDKASALKAFRALKAADPFADGVDEAIRELEHQVEGSKI